MTPKDLLNDADTLKDWIVRVRRELHRHPELMYEERETASVVRRELAQLRIRCLEPVATTGVIAMLGTGMEPCVALRADMDALPITEEADVDFKSERPGLMHACGHDCHTAMLLGAAAILKSHEATIHGTIKLLFQPAEEGGAGGLKLCEAGALDAPTVQRAFGLHVWPLLPTGVIGSRSGTLLASAGMVEISITGAGGHAAMPHTVKDPITTAAGVVGALQTIVSRETDPLESAVVTISTIHGGEAFNVIPAEVRLTGTLRSLTTAGLQTLKERVRAIATAVAAAHRCEATVNFPGYDYPATVNDAASWHATRGVATDMLGENAVRELSPIMGGEDFAYILERVPGCFVALGVGNKAKKATYMVHHPKFTVDEDALPIGSALHAAVGLRMLADLNAVMRPNSNSSAAPPSHRSD